MDMEMEILKSLTGNTFRWSLPCDVNSSVLPSRDCQFLEEARKTRAIKGKEYTAIDMGTECDSLLDHDALAQSHDRERGVAAEEPVHTSGPIAAKFTSKATLQISNVNVEDPVPLDFDNSIDKKPFDLESLQTKVMQTNKYSLFIPANYGKREPDEKKVDENGNALHQNPGTKAKKKKTLTDKNVVVLTAESVEGHRSDIINDVDKLIQFIGGEKDGAPPPGGGGGGKARSHVHKSKQLHKQHASEDGGAAGAGRGGGGGGGGKKQRAHSSKGKEPRPELKKSNSLGEISTATKMDPFPFGGGAAGGGVAAAQSEEKGAAKVVLRQARGQQDGGKPKERRSWGNVEPPPFQSLYANASVENLETSDNWVVTKPKKKSKKRRNSTSSSGGRQALGSEAGGKRSDGAASPDLRGKSARSVPHSDKSNDSSDVDSVHSLPIDGLNGAPISYADIAKNGEKAVKKISPEKAVPSPTSGKDQPNGLAATAATAASKPLNLSTVSAVKSTDDQSIGLAKVKPPDVHNIKSFPAISPVNKAVSVAVVDRKVFGDVCKGAASANGSASKNGLNVNVVNNNANVAFKDGCAKVADGAVKTSSGNGLVVNCVDGGGNATKVGVGVGVVEEEVREKVLREFDCGGETVENDILNDLSILHSNERESIRLNARMLPADIPDVQTIEKMQLQRGAADVAAPAVVILSGPANRDVAGLVFGFDVNEQLLHEDACDRFVARYAPPDAYTRHSHNHDKIVNFIGSAWEAIVNQTNGKYQYYTEETQ